MDSEGTVKIADFGFARSLFGTGYYRLGSTKKIPIKWVSPELLDNNARFSTKSDVVRFDLVHSANIIQE